MVNLTYVDELENKTNNTGTREIPKTKCEQNEAGHQLFIDWKVAYDSVSSVQ